MNTNELYNAPQKLNEDLNLEISLHDVIEFESSAFVQQTFDKYKTLVEEGVPLESKTNYKTNKTKNHGNKKHIKRRKPN